MLFKEKVNNPIKCSWNVLFYVDNWPYSRQCKRKWRIEVEGIYYCTQHSPEKVEERKANVYWDKNWEDHRRGWASKAACIGVPIKNLPEGIVKKLIDFVYEMDNIELIKEIEGKN